MIIKNADIIGEKRIFGCLRIEDGKIKEIAKDIAPFDGEDIIDAEGNFLFPGGIDPHTHLQMENALAKVSDSYETGTLAALKGGTTTIINFATGKPDMTLRESYLEEMRRAEKSSCNYRFHMELVNITDDILNEMQDMMDLDVTSFKIYMAYAFRIGDRDIYKVLKRAKEIGALVESHCENGELLDEIMEDLVKEGKNNANYQEVAHPNLAEAEAISRLCYISKLADHPVHVVHLSTKEGLEEIKNKRKEGFKVTAETCTQYLLIDNSVYDLDKKEASKYVYAPPAHSKKDVEEIKKGVLDKEIITLGTDHCPFDFQALKTKSEDLRKIPGGLPGIENRVEVAYTILVNDNNMPVEDFVEFMSTNSAKLYNMYPDRGVIREGSIADLVIYEKNSDHIIDVKDQLMNVDYNPYHGFKVKGRVKDVFLKGEHVVSDGKVIKKYLGEYAKNASK